jgi:hypothetical protein
MIKRKRNGMALITVVLISALLFVSIISITLKVIPENKIIAARSASERALSAVETGLSQVIFNLRNANFEAGTTAPYNNLEYLKITDVEAIAEATSGSSPFTYSEAPPVPGGSGTPYVVYQVKIKTTAGGGFDPNNPNQESVDSTLDIFSLGTVYDKPNGQILARKAIRSTFQVTFSKTPQTYNVDYGLLAGGNLEFIGNANLVYKGDIYAGGYIDKNNASDNVYVVLDGYAYACLNIDDSIVQPDKAIEGAPPIGDKIDGIINALKAYNQALADAFKNGTGPYDGTNSDYPNTNPNTFPGLTGMDKTIIQNIMSDYLTDNIIDPKNKDYDGKNVLTFYNDVKSGKIISDNPALTPNGMTFFSDLTKPIDSDSPKPIYLDKSAVYYNGSLSEKELENLNIGGTIVVEGDLKINSSITINLQENPLLIRVTGNVDLAGGAILNGNIFASSEDANTKIGVGDFTLNGYLVSPRNINVNGNFECNGSLISKGNIQLKGGVEITYKERGLGLLEVPYYVLDQPKAHIKESTWNEISYDDFIKTKSK